MSSVAPRSECPECGREIAVVSGRFARHDPPGRLPGAPQISCAGSHTAPPSTFLSPDRFGTPSVFELLEGSLAEDAIRARQIQDPLFPRPSVNVL
jgi:hypothetical protein